ncbi:MAG: hypothetical protein V4568_19575 [Pseudomonadota bacterium]
MVDLYRRKISAMIYQMAQEDPPLILKVIEELKKSGEIEPDDLLHIERIAQKWIRIAQENQRKK